MIVKTMNSLEQKVETTENLIKNRNKHKETRQTGGLTRKIKYNKLHENENHKDA